MNDGLSANRTPDKSASTLWETAKAYMRGVIDSYTVCLPREKKNLKGTVNIRRYNE